MLLTVKFLSVYIVKLCQASIVISLPVMLCAITISSFHAGSDPVLQIVGSFQLPSFIVVLVAA